MRMPYFAQYRQMREAKGAEAECVSLSESQVAKSLNPLAAMDTEDKSSLKQHTRKR